MQRYNTNDRPPYTGDGLECIANLRPDTNEPHVLRNVARWHSDDRRRAGRHAKIAAALYVAAASAETADLDISGERQEAA